LLELGGFKNNTNINLNSNVEIEHIVDKWGQASFSQFISSLQKEWFPKKSSLSPFLIENKGFLF